MLCPTHGVQLTDTGPLRPRAQVKVVMDGTVRGRFMVTEGGAVAVCRAPAGGGMALGSWIDESAVETVSRTHVLLAYDDGALTVLDERSANGTRIGRRLPGGDTTVPLEHGVARRLREGDSVVLHDRLELLPSASQFVFGTDPADGTVAQREGGAAAGPTMMQLPLHDIE
ncbi:FHA domain-containing protein [Streptomyces sp. IBSBF 2435]|uniref:FHA domain-containing protein n=1 Tax=Streptomyces sp. IBSBF 2435 TaxID=2903531 RepID=UPI002FDC1EE0